MAEWYSIVYKPCLYTEECIFLTIFPANYNTHLRLKAKEPTKEGKNNLRPYPQWYFWWCTKIKLGQIRAYLLCLRFNIIWNNFPVFPLSFSEPSSFWNSEHNRPLVSWSMVEEVFLDLNWERLGWSRIWILRISLSSHHYILTAPLKTLIYTTYQQKITGQVLNKSYSEGTLLRIVLIRFGNSLSF